jgi:hypothetical protein
MKEQENIFQAEDPEKRTKGGRSRKFFAFKFHYSHDLE